MDQAKLRTLIADCRAVLKQNDRGNYTMPATELYPHQWLWDSCFIAIGLRHLDPLRAQAELISLLRGQWSNGMLPNLLFSEKAIYETDRRVWFSRVSPFAPPDTATSGITQPPMLAEAVFQVGQKLPKHERVVWYKYMLPSLERYHTWLYAERDPHQEGLALLIHPYETGLDNTPPWIEQLLEHNRPWWVATIKSLGIERAINLVRRDTRSVPPSQRASNLEALIYWDVVRRLKRKKYEINKILRRSLFCIEDLSFNSILQRANTLLVTIADEADYNLNDDLLRAIERSKQAFDRLWDEHSQTYYSRDFITHEFIKQPSIASLLPLYSGVISKQRAATLVSQLTDTKQFWLNYPVPSVPLESKYFNPICYWQGPSWINTNWLIISGLRQYGYDDLANQLTEKSLSLVAKHGCWEYFSPTDGKPLGSPNFSWTASLTLDLIDQTQTKSPATTRSRQSR